MKKLILLFLLGFGIQAMETSPLIELEEAINRKEEKTWECLPNELKAHILVCISNPIADIKNLLLVSHEFNDLVNNTTFLRIFFQELITYNPRKALHVYKLATKLYKEKTLQLFLDCDGINQAVVRNMIIADIEGAAFLFCAAAAQGNRKVVELFLATQNDCELNSHNCYAFNNTSQPRGLAFLVNAGIIPNGVQTHNGRGLLPLKKAVAHGRHEIVTLLIENGAELEFRAKSVPPRTDEEAIACRTVLIDAIVRNDKEMVELLVDHGASPNSTDSLGHSALMYAAREGCAEIAEILLKNGARVDYQMKYSAYYDAADEHWTGDTALIIDASHGCTKVVEVLIEYNANVNYQMAYEGNTPLIAAAKNGHIEMVKLLVAHNADSFVRMRIQSKNSRKEQWKTATQIACENGHYEMVSLLDQWKCLIS